MVNWLLLYHYIFMAYFSNPIFDLLLKIALRLDPLEDGMVTVMVTEEKVGMGGGNFLSSVGKGSWVLLCGLGGALGVQP